jgi:ribosome biogenesis GTPase A
MAKAERGILEISRVADVIFEVLDARIPWSSRGDYHLRNKPCILILNKSDLADRTDTGCWLNFFNKNGFTAFAVDSKVNNSSKVISAVNKIFPKRTGRLLSVRKRFDCFRAVVIGTPNVGKSSFINSVLGRRKTKVENRAGVTSQNSWHRFGNIEICDTPGILRHRLGPEVGESIAFVGGIKSEIIDPELVAYSLVTRLKELINEKYLGCLDLSLSAEEVIENFGKLRNFISPGKNVDIRLAASVFLKSFQDGKFGKITLERVNKYGNT